MAVYCGQLIFQLFRNLDCLWNIGESSHQCVISLKNKNKIMYKPLWKCGVCHCIPLSVHVNLFTLSQDPKSRNCSLFSWHYRISIFLILSEAVYVCTLWNSCVLNLPMYEYQQCSSSPLMYFHSVIRKADLLGRLKCVRTWRGQRC
jgi:hypothetical protein